MIKSSLSWIADKRVLFVALLVVASLALLYLNGMHFGLEFTGGTRIPVTLEKPVTKATMDDILTTIKIRVTKFGLSQVVVRSVGDQQVYVELSQSTSPEYISQVQTILRSEGKFEAIIDGQVALEGDNIVSGSVRNMAETSGENVRWGVAFVINQDGAKQFSNAAYGKGNYPVNLFLDRTEESAILIKESYINSSLSISEAKSAMEKVAGYGNNVVIYTDSSGMTPEKVVDAVIASNRTKATVSRNETELIDLLRARNITIDDNDDSDMLPEIVSMGNLGGINVNQWPAIGLLSAPTLSPNLATGQSVQQFSIEGPAKGATYQEKQLFATAEMKKIRSILSGGALPVGIELGSAITVPPSLGREFLKYSAIGMIAAALVVFLIVALRYRHISHLLPLLFIAGSQMTILVCFMTAVGTLDLSTIAGLFGTLGTSVDYQIIMTDELIGKESGGKDEAKRRLEKAAYIITRDVAILIVVMMPLMFSNIVEIIGFVTTTLLGSILGIGITLLTYNAVIDHQYKD